jgi:hypothetical protein
MKYLIIACAAMALASCADKTAPTAQPAVNDLIEGYALGEPVTHGNATFIPVVSTVPMDQLPEQDTVTLSEAKKNGWVEIIEVPGEEQVEFLSVRNTGDKPIYLMSGQLLLGGKQDRIVAEDTIVPPGKTVKVRVYCVEHGRWNGASMHFDYSETMVPDKVRKSAQYEGQAAVWDSVAEKNETVRYGRTSAATPSSSIKTYLTNDEVKGKVSEGAKAALEKINGPNVVGVVFALNGEIQTFEMFATPGLFAQAAKPLIESFIAEAVMTESNDKKLDNSKVRDFVRKCLAAPQGDKEGVNQISVAGQIRGNNYKTAAGAAPIHGSFEPTR